MCLIPWTLQSSSEHTGHQTSAQNDNVDQEIPSPPTIDGANKIIMPPSIIKFISAWDNTTSLLGELKQISRVTRIEYNSLLLVQPGAKNERRCSDISRGLPTVTLKYSLLQAGPRQLQQRQM